MMDKTITARDRTRVDFLLNRGNRKHHRRRYRRRRSVQESGLKARQAKRARKRASGYNILTRFLFNYRPVMASLRSLITSSPTGFELIPDARLQPRFLAI